MRRVTRQSSHLLFPSSKSQTCPSGISARRFLRQSGQYMNTCIMVLSFYGKSLFVWIKFVHRRCCQCFLDAPPFGKSLREGVRMHSDSPRPLGNCERNSIMREVVGRALVVVLLLVSLPSHVTGLIVSVIIDPAYRCFRKRLGSHVLKEVLEGFQPSDADGDLTGSVILEQLVVRFVASRLHVLPASVLSRPATCGIGCVTMSSYSASSTTGTSCAITKSYANNDQFNAALTTTIPVRTLVRFKRFPSVTKNSELSVDISSLVFHSRVDSQRTSKSATTATAGCKVVPSDEVCRAAITQDVPVQNLSATFTHTGNDETAKSLPSEIFEIVGASDRMTRRHDSTPDWIMVRAKTVHNDCLGSFHFSIN
jgi:hypothetical protein